MGYVETFDFPDAKWARTMLNDEAQTMDIG
jgi:hypothetical protein